MATTTRRSSSSKKAGAKQASRKKAAKPIPKAKAPKKAAPKKAAPKRRPLITQSRYGADILKIGGQLAKVRRLEAQRFARAEAMRKATPAQKTKLKAARAAERRAAYAEKRRLLKAYGMYSPVGALAELTPSQRARVNAQYRQLESLIQGSSFAYYPTKAKATRRQIKSQARKSGAKATLKGIFVPRESKELRVQTGKLHYDERTGLWEVLVKRRYTDRRGRKHTVYERRPVAGAPALEAKRQAIRERFERMGAPGKGQRLRFIIQGRNVSKRTFGSLADVLEYAEKRYRKTDRARATFLDTLTIQVIERANKSKRMGPTRNAAVVRGFDAHRAKASKANLRAIEKARRRGVPDYMLEGFEDMDEGEEE